MLFKLAYKSLMNRKLAVTLTVVSITLGILLLISFGFIKDQVKSSFTKTINGIDLIVGPKTSDINLMLYSVFHTGSATDNISWDSYQHIANDPAVKSVIPVSLGDSHKGYRVIGTTKSYLDNYRYGNKHYLDLEKGDWFNHPFEVVMGFEVAEKLNYDLAEELVLSHGISKTSFKQHDQFKFRVSGILQQTGTPIDKSIFVSLSGLETVHLNWPKDHKKQTLLMEHIIKNGLQPKSITAAFVTLKNKSSTFVFQRQINQIKSEPLQAILPGVTLAKMWSLSAIFEKTLWLVGVMVFVSTIIGLVNMLIVSLNSRKKELALLRIIGASPIFCFMLIQIESMFVVMISMLMSIIISYLSFHILGDWLSAQYGFFIEISSFFNTNLLYSLMAVFMVSVTLVCVPAVLFYKQSTLKNID